jgi:trehalose-phosphatase
MNFPEYFFDSDVLSRFLSHGGKTPAGIALFLDFDGTLTPLRKDPSQCFVSHGLKERLRILAGCSEICMAILSGRALADVRKRVGIARIIYGGSHGLDIAMAGFRFTDSAAKKAMSLIARAKRMLEVALIPYEGVRLEDKKYTLSLHFRCARNEDISPVKRVFSLTVAEFVRNGQLRVIKGKKVLELAPAASWDKGRAALMILDLVGENLLPIMIGDDVTDESAFNALAGMGVTIRVGRSAKTAAQYYLKNQGEVEKFLKDLSERLGSGRDTTYPSARDTCKLLTADGRNQLFGIAPKLR